VAAGLINTTEVQYMSLHRLILVLAAVLVLVACGPGEPGAQSATPQAGEQSTTPAAGGLEGMTWTLTQFGPADAPTTVPEGISVTVEFADGNVGGNAPCNSYGGPYTTEGQNLSIGEMTQTLRACANNSLMELESRYLEALRQATTYTIQGDQLTLSYPTGELHFTRGGAATE
jgi:heat shock protein HslJ